mmetsp:Transcript_48116/g.80935  ORF Transcript_48116/g.80935 Transcript_48116/m.80935 type:complete len:266 (-) Transcript_48116:231-1028(-)
MGGPRDTHDPRVARRQTYSGPGVPAWDFPNGGGKAVTAAPSAVIHPPAGPPQPAAQQRVGLPAPAVEHRRRPVRGRAVASVRTPKRSGAPTGRPQKDGETSTAAPGATSVHPGAERAGSYRVPGGVGAGITEWRMIQGEFLTGLRSAAGPQRPPLARSAHWLVPSTFPRYVPMENRSRDMPAGAGMGVGVAGHFPHTACASMAPMPGPQRQPYEHPPELMNRLGYLVPDTMGRSSGVWGRAPMRTCWTSISAASDGMTSFAFRRR